MEQAPGAWELTPVDGEDVRLISEQATGAKRWLPARGGAPDSEVGALGSLGRASLATDHDSLQQRATIP